MKKFFPVVIFLLCLFTSAHSQVQIGQKGWQLKRIGVSFGQDQDRISNMNHADFFNAIRNDEGQVYEGIQFQSQDITSTSMVCENPNIRVYAGLEHSKLRNTEIRLAANIIWNRIDAMVHDYSYQNGASSYLAVDAYSNELALEAAILKKFKLGSITVYGGAGANVGKTFGNSVCVSGNNVTIDQSGMGEVEIREGNDTGNETYFYDHLHECHDAYSANHVRAFLQGGIGITILKRVEIDWEVRYGIGAKNTPNVGTTSTNLISTGLGINYIFKS